MVKRLPTMWGTAFNPWVGKIHWRRERLPTPVFWPGEFHGLYSPWGCKEQDMTERLHFITMSQVSYYVLGTTKSWVIFSRSQLQIRESENLDTLTINQFYNAGIFKVM